MIRLANKFDIAACVEMMRHYAAEAQIDVLADTAAHDDDHVRELLTSLIAGRGFVLIDDKQRGMLAAIIQRNFWCPSVIELHEVAWWVHPDHRHRSIGGRLFKAFDAQAQILRDNGRVNVVFLSLLEQSPIKALPGYRRMDSTFVKV